MNIAIAVDRIGLITQWSIAQGCNGLAEDCPLIEMGNGWLDDWRTPLLNNFLKLSHIP